MKIQIDTYEFDLTDRYASGSVLTAEEAKALNVERAERIRNKAARYLARVKPEDGSVLTGEARGKLNEFISDLDINFEFTSRDKAKAKVGTLEAEIRELALERAEARARQAGRAGDTALIAQIAAELESDPDMELEAAKRVEARKAVAMNGFGDL